MAPAIRTVADRLNLVAFTLLLEGAPVWMAAVFYEVAAEVRARERRGNGD